MTNSQREPNQEQHSFISEMLKRQDDVLKQIDQLNDRIERLISEISQDRRAENERQDQNATPVLQSDADVDSDDTARREAA